MTYSVDVIQAVCSGDTAEYLEASIESILGQTCPVSKYFIVIDGPISRDIQSVLDKYPSKITLLRNEGRKGLAGALNTAIRASDGDILVRMDSDDVSEPHRVERLLDEFYSDPNLLVVGSGAKEVDWKGQVFFRKTLPPDTEGILKMAPTRPPFIHVSIAFKRIFFTLAGLYDENFYKAQDYDLWARVIIHHPELLSRMKNVDDALVVVRLPKNFWVKRSLANIRYGTGISLRIIRNQGCWLQLFPLFAKILIRLAPASIKKSAYKYLR